MSVFSAQLVLFYISAYAHLLAHSAQALVWALAQASWVNVAYLGAIKRANAWWRTCLQHLAVALRDSWCLPEPICSKAVRVSWGVCMSLYSKRFFPFVGLVYECLFCTAYLVLHRGSVFVWGALCGESVGMGPYLTKDDAANSQTAQTRPGDSWPQHGSFNVSRRSRRERWICCKFGKHAARLDQESSRQPNAAIEVSWDPDRSSSAWQKHSQVSFPRPSWTVFCAVPPISTILLQACGAFSRGTGEFLGLSIRSLG